MTKSKLVLVIVVALLLASAGTAIVVLPMRGGGGGTTASTRSPETTASSRGTTDARTALGPVSEHRTAERAAMLAAIASAREAREHRTASPTRTPATPGALPTMGNDSSATTLDLTDNTGDTSDWEKRSLGTLNHLLGQCYDLGRAEDANLAGIVVLQFTIVGEPNIGGLLEHVEILDANTTITQKTIRDCFTEQLYALELDPPPDGVTVKRELHLKVP